LLLFEKKIMRNIHIPARQITQRDARGLPLHKLIGRWVYVQDGTGISRIVIQTGIEDRDRETAITVAALSEESFDRISSGERWNPHDIEAHLLRGTLLSFSANDGKGCLRSSENRDLEFAVLDDTSKFSALPEDELEALEDELSDLAKYPVGETFALANDRIITAHKLNYDLDSHTWLGVVRAECAFSRPLSTQILVSLLSEYNIQPVTRSADLRTDTGHLRKFNA
jgi:hypothetical protein